MTDVWFNENDGQAAAWLRSLIDACELPSGVVDERSIVDIKADDVPVGGRAHFFAGIGGWELALRWAGVPDELEVWTGSCPCQPFSNAGKRGGVADERHLWPKWRRLIAERRPAAIFGEQVASKAGRDWFAAVRADLENLGYAVGAADLCAAGVGAPHIRQRLFFGAVRVADGGGAGLEELGVKHARDERAPAERSCEVGGMAYDDDAGRGGEQGLRLWRSAVHDADRRGPGGGTWAAFERVYCRDEKWRPVEPGVFPLAHGLPARVGRLRGYGNAIVPQVAAEFVTGFFEAL